MGTSRADKAGAPTILVPESHPSFARATPDQEPRNRSCPIALANSTDRSRRVTALAIAASLGASGLVSAAIPLAHAPGVVVIPPSEVLAEHTLTAPDGTLLFAEPSGAFVPFIVTTDDPQISNAGDGSFHSANVEAVIAALENLPSVFLAPLEVTVFVLPYPRSFALESSATGDAIFLSPGVHPLNDGETLRALVCHEMGHVVHGHYLPDTETADWQAYSVLRGIDDSSKFHASAAHAYRPHEIFAEDFRLLFGDELAADPAHENPEIDPPQAAAGLASFFTGLTGAMSSTSEVANAQVAVGVELYPNPVPAGGSVFFPAAQDGAGSIGAALARMDPPEVAIVDASGRTVARLGLSPAADGWSGSVPGLAMGGYWAVAPGARPVSIRVSR